MREPGEEQDAQPECVCGAQGDEPCVCGPKREWVDTRPVVLTDADDAGF